MLCCCPAPSLTHFHRIQRQYFEKEAAAGRLATWVPPVEEPPRTLLQTVGLPGFTSTYKQDAELSVATTMSKNMWTSNPGYVLRDGAHMASSMHKDYVWDEDAVSSKGVVSSAG
jgi:hypothetical protein